MTTTVTLYEPDGTPFVLAEGDVMGVETTRGKSTELDTIDAGSFSVTLQNKDRKYDPYFITTSGFLTQTNGDFLTQTNGDKIIINISSNDTGPYGAIAPSRKVVIKDGTTVVFTGYAENFEYTYDRDRNIVVMSGFDSFGSLAQAKFSQWETTAGQLPGERIAAGLDRSEVGFPASTRDLDDGVTPLVGDLVAANTDALGYFQKVAQSDFGRLFVAREGDLTYRSRHTAIASPSVAFTDGETANFKIGRATVRFGTRLYHPQWEISRGYSILAPADANGNRATVQVNGVPQVAKNQAAIDAYPGLGVRQGGITGLLVDHDAYCMSMSEYFADRYSDMKAVVSGMTIKLDAMGSSNRATVCALEIGDYVTASWVPTGEGAPVAQNLIVEGVDYSAQRDQPKTITLNLSEYDDRDYFTLEDSTLGYIDDPDILLAF